MTDSTLFDVAIIGGGLAGLSLAIQCADGGHSVVLFEKENYPFHKVCGEYISLESKPFLQSLGISVDQFNLPIITQLHLTDAYGKPYNFKLPQGGFGISRFLLDDELYKMCLQKGVHVLTGTKVNNVTFNTDHFLIETSVGTFKSEVAAGTFGKRSNIDVKLHREFIHRKPGKLENYIGVKYHVKYPQPISTISLHNFNNGYCGISNIEDNTCCLCYLTTAANLKKSGNSIKEMEQRVLYKNPALKHIFENAGFVYSQPIVISQISFNKKSQVEGNMLMIGDAAGMITPLCGNGMSMALHASKLAFNSINKFVQKKISRSEMEAEYCAMCKKHFAKRLSVGRAVQQIFGGAITTSLFLKTMQAVPALANLVIKSTHGKPF